MLDRDQNQQGGDNAINAQAGRDVIVQGVTYAEARQIAVDVYRANALELQGVAQQSARERAEHLIDQFLIKMQAKGIERIEQAATPDFQNTLFEAQKAYARSGDDNLEGVLVDLLASRADEPNRTLRQVVLNEAVTAAARLTADQLNLLTLIFLVRHCKSNDVATHHQIVAQFVRLIPLVASIPESEATYSYLVYSGVATIEMAQITLQEILRQGYPGLFSAGHENGAFATVQQTEPAAMSLVGPCSHDDSRLQVLALDTDVLMQRVQQLGISEQTHTTLANLLKQNLLSDERMLAIFAPSGEGSTRLFRMWNSTIIKQCVLTSVGMAIGHANGTRLGMVTGDLEIWIR